MKARVGESISTRCLASSVLLLAPLVLVSPMIRAAQRKPASPKPRANQLKPVDELAKLREEFIKATKDYKANLEKLLAIHEKSVRRAEDRVTQSRELFTQGLISKNDFEASERGVAEAKIKVTEVNQRIAGADTQIADTLLEAEAETKLARSKPIPKGGLVKTASFIRYNGSAIWALSDAWKVQRFFLDAFKKPLPIAVFGQGAIHDRWRLDHHNAMDVSLHPDGPEGQALLTFLRNNGIPFLAFREVIPGTATGPHIHIGRPSHRY
ncbi:MAG: TolC family protein [Acidobacteriota bacterium]|nr:TolC family protein [Acidobacteriota bacterium]